jgi:predicted nucleotide-binding protein
MAKRPTPTAPAATPRLTCSRIEAEKRLLDRIAKGTALKDRPVSSSPEYDQWEQDLARFNDFNAEMLRRLYTTEEYSNRYKNTGSYFMGFGDTPFYKQHQEDLGRLADRLNYLQTLVEALDLIDEPVDVAAEAPTAGHRRAITGQKVFIVHGRDEEAKSVVARFLSGCDLEAIILHEQPDRGRTIIEKFEQTADVAFAVVLITPDDEGRLKGDADMHDRGRQNVILELGYFIGRLGRERVCSLVRGNVELPSDYAGVVYTPMDAAGAWKMLLARELRAAGLPVDLNKALA